MAQSFFQHPLLMASDTFPDVLTTLDTYVTVGDWNCGLLKTKRFRFSSLTNTLDVTILGSLNDGVSFPLVVVAEFDVLVATPVVQTITDLVTTLRVQVKPTVGGAHGTLSTQFAGWSY